ncbi:MAG TPA: YhcH/YjgK/YiaL family protein [Bacteroidales bacterium]
MKNLLLKIMILTSFLGFFGCKSSSDPAKWSSTQIDKWFEKGEWLNGWTVLPDASINRKEFAISYFKNKERWDKAFTFLKSNDLPKLEVKRFEIDGVNVFAPVTDYLSKNEEDANFEAHRKYIDIQYVINGVEMEQVAPLTMKKEEVTPYNEVKDIEFMTVTKSSSYKATPDRFFIFFPSEAHRPGIKAGENSQVRKIVVKIKVE